MIKNFAQDIAKIEVGRNWAYGFVKRHHTDLGCTWFDGFDIARRRADNTPSGWRRTGLLPFDPEVVLSQIAKIEEEDPDTDSDSADSRALQKPTARELRRLVDNVVDKSRDSGSSARKLKSTLESLQAEVELLRSENQGLRETIIYEKQRRQRGKALKDYLFDRTDPNSAQVFSPAKIAQARLKKATIEAKKQEEAFQKQTEKAQRQQKAAAQKAQALERRRERDEERERKRQVKEARKQEREVNRQIREALKESNRGISKQKQPKLQEDFNAIEENERTQDEIIVAVPPSVEMPAPSISPSHCKTTSEKKMKMTSAGITGSKRPSLVVESAREMVVSYWDSGRPQRNSKRPRWLEDYEIN
ncbi:hypothetical protein E5D57_013340 [Metarhizium anisopliae]|nr:hypothetical protein E5D57_013159 [Metarhizium anisopliae]KAF5120827.1 hypothetical protein E5D57_013163 [Metarhizium anisopliae]KAF5121004.1 hypothetical protein E5D57_013340 [Metarhizium anisopliae]